MKGAQHAYNSHPTKGSEPEQPKEQPKHPLDKVSTDLFTLNGKKFILIVDWWSQYLWVSCLNREPETNDIIKFLTNTFNQVGWASHLRIDNGPRYSTHFGKLCTRADIE